MKHYPDGIWIDCLDRFFNWKEYSAFCEEMRAATDKAVAEYNGFGYNICDCCLNPLDYMFQGANYRIRISVSETPRGWVHGISYTFGKGLDIHGGAWPCAYDNTIVSPTAEAAKVAAFDHLLQCRERKPDERYLLLTLRRASSQLTLF